MKDKKIINDVLLIEGETVEVSLEGETTEVINSDDFSVDEVISRWEEIFEDEPNIKSMLDLLKDTSIHKELVKKAAEFMARGLRKRKAFGLADKIIARAEVHDNSKLHDFEEFSALATISKYRFEMSFPDVKVSPEKEKAIDIHRRNPANDHHPEHFKNVMDMPRAAVVEMVCDWWARSKQYHSNFMDWVFKKQRERFNFPDFMFMEILHYCDIILEEEELEEENKESTNHS